MGFIFMYSTSPLHLFYMQYFLNLVLSIFFYDFARKTHFGSPKEMVEEMDDLIVLACCHDNIYDMRKAAQSQTFAEHYSPTSNINLFFFET